MGFDYEAWVQEGFVAWLRERVKKADPGRHPSEHVGFTQLYSDYRAWCAGHRVDALGRINFAREFVEDQQAERYYRGEKVYFAGIVLRA